jgi:hypothetical protein
MWVMRAHLEYLKMYANTGRSGRKIAQKRPNDVTQPVGESGSASINGAPVRACVYVWFARQDVAASAGTSIPIVGLSASSALKMRFCCLLCLKIPWISSRRFIIPVWTICARGYSRFTQKHEHHRQQSYAESIQINSNVWLVN